MVSDERLYEEMVAGDLGGFDRLYARYETTLFVYILNYIPNRSEAEDILHDTFLQLAKAKRGPPRIQSFRAWIFSICRNLCLNRMRSESRRSKAMQALASQVSEESTLEHAIQHRQAESLLRQAMDRLPRNLSEALGLRMRGMSYSEIADVLGIPLGTVKSRLHETTKKLREVLLP